MRNLRQIIKEELLLEKRITQVRTSFEVAFSFDVKKTKHADDRETRNDIEGYSENSIDNDEIKEIINMSKREIAEKIVNQEIIPDEEFVIKSLKWELAIAIVAIHVAGTHWKLLIKTIFRESKNNPFRVGAGQLVIYLD
jgi:hypothetical protein